MFPTIGCGICLCLFRETSFASTSGDEVKREKYDSEKDEDESEGARQFSDGDKGYEVQTPSPIRDYTDMDAVD